MVDFRINETRQTGAVGNRTYGIGLNAVRSETVLTRNESVYLFLGFTIVWKEGRRARQGRKGKKGVAPQKSA